MSPEMSRKWLVALLASIGLALVNCQTNATTTTSTTISPNSNTTSTTTPEPQTTTTTPKPTPSTEPPTPPKPPKPDIVNKTVENENGTCIRVYFSGIQINITYNTSNPNITQFNTGFTIPSNASVDEANSHCSPSDSEIQIIAISFGTKFEPEEHTSANLSLTFNKTDNDIEVSVVKLSFILTEDLFPQFHDSSVYGQIVTLERSDMSLFRVASAHSYVCSQSIPADLGSHEDIVDVNIDFQDPHVQAFMAKGNKDFDSEIDCKSSEISDVVPIAVGAALAGLVVIVLIAYFIGRRRSRRLAYQSV